MRKIYCFLKEKEREQFLYYNHEVQEKEKLVEISNISTTWKMCLLRQWKVTEILNNIHPVAQRSGWKAQAARITELQWPGVRVGNCSLSFPSPITGGAKIQLLLTFTLYFPQHVSLYKKKRVVRKAKPS